MERLSQELIETQAVLQRTNPSLVQMMEDNVEQSQLDNISDPRVPMGNSIKDPMSIHFVFSASSVSEEEKAAFSERITNDLDVRGLDMGGDISTRQKRLKDNMIMEWVFREIQKSLAHGEKLKKGNAIFVIMDAAPCVLHGENRMGLKMLTMLLIEGLSNARDHKLYPNIRSEKTRRELFIKKVEEHINTSILGCPGNPAQWQCTTEDNGKKIGTISLDNNRTRKIVENFEGLIDMCVPECDSRNRDWKYCLSHYVPAMKMLRRKPEFTNAEILDFQRQADLFFQRSVLLTSGLVKPTTSIFWAVAILRSI